MKIIFLFLIFFTSVYSNQKYLKIPLQRKQNRTYAAHIIAVQINQYPYDIQIQFSKNKNTILSLDTINKYKTKTGQTDYRKHQNGIIGVFNYYGVEFMNQKSSFFKKIAYNNYYFVRDFFQRLAWMNLKEIEQIQYHKKVSTFSDGIFYFGPQSKTDSSLKQYNKYMKNSIASIKMHDQTNEGTLFLGDYPIRQLQDPNNFTTTPISTRGKQRWVISTSSLIFIRKETTSFQKQVNIYKQMTNISILLNQKTLKVSNRAFQNFYGQLFGCELRNKIIFCKNFSKKIIQNSYFSITTQGSSFPIKIRLKDLVIYGDSYEQISFNIVASQSQQYHIGSALLGSYLVGIDYEQGILYYGKKSKQPFFERNLVIKIIIWGSFILFLISLAILFFEKDIRKQWLEQMNAKKDKQSPYIPSKTSGYQKAASQQTFSRQQS